jgi:WD40 repeat protein
VKGAVLAIKDSENCFSTWDITTGLFIRRFVGHDDSSAPSEETISCKCMPWLHAWPEDECPAVGHRSDIVAMDISRFGSRIVSVDVDGFIFLWDAGTAAVLHKTKAHNPCEPMAVAFSPDESHYVVTDSEGFVAEYRSWDGIHISTPYYPSRTAMSRCETRAVVWTPGSTQYICGYERGQVKTFDSAYTHYDDDDDDDRPNGGLYLKRSEDAANVLAISPDEKFVAVAGERVIGDICNEGRMCGFVAVYNHSPKNTLRWKDFATPGHDGGMICLSFSLDGKQLASAGMDKFVRLWDPRDGTRLKAFQMRVPVTPSWAKEQILVAGNIVSVTFCADLEETPERHERRLAFAQGHHKRLGASSIIEVLLPDLLRTIGLMV